LPLSDLAGNNPASCREKNTPTPDLNSPDLNENALEEFGSGDFLRGEETGENFGQSSQAN
jgi:hypothetical protein